MAVLMTVELANKLIDHYEKCIAEVTRCEYVTDLYSAVAVCIAYDTHHGLCHCARERYRIAVNNCGWLRSHYTSKSQWVCGQPFKASTVQAVVNRLQYRVNILKSFTQPPPTLP